MDRKATMGQRRKRKRQGETGSEAIGIDTRTIMTKLGSLCFTA